MIVFAPLVSVSLQKDPMSVMPGMHHEMNMMTEHPTPSESMPVDHAEACGYCVLLAHVPGVMLALVMLLCAVLLRQRLTPPRPAVRYWHFSPWLCPDTRAPPRLSA
ncbi:DUF2946 domain-containing protein [Leclercia adecarboxylata]|uniref:DUF2946 domain-containing protein n=1 Tax=Leclercia adecarboxylata TaxID=83655 RepID=UPI002DC5AF5B|nr:DUF2946 domain-containing protein [Leclercia adecarboxylata]